MVFFAKRQTLVFRCYIRFIDDLYVYVGTLHFPYLGIASLGAAIARYKETQIRDHETYDTKGCVYIFYWLFFSYLRLNMREKYNFHWKQREKGVICF